MEYGGSKIKVGRLAELFGESYKLLAYHAALPLVLTPELLNYLRNKFLGDKVPWVAEVDLLLSDLCKEIAYEQFAMDPDTRAYLLAEADEKLGRPHMQDVARLLIRYVHSLSGSASAAGSRQLQAQRWAAMVYLDEQRETAVQEIAESFLRSMTPVDTSAGPLGSSFVDESELARLSQITQMLAPQLEASQELIEYAAEVSLILAAGSEKPRASPASSKPARVANVTLPAPSMLLGEIVLKDEIKDNAEPDLFISFTSKDEGFLQEHLLPLLKAQGLNYFARLRRSDSTRLKEFIDLERAIRRGWHVLIFVSHDTRQDISSLLRVLSDPHDDYKFEEKILLGITKRMRIGRSLSRLRTFRFYGSAGQIEGQLKLLVDRLRDGDMSEEDRTLSARLLIGEAPAFRRVVDMAIKVAPTQATVLIKGEVGTGKQLLAYAIQQHSQRASSPFITVDCTNIQPELLESELFGHVRGAFTGAVAAKKGLFQVADGGTLFFDEISHMPIRMQALLLRFIEERYFTPLGGTRPIRVDVRVIASTSVDLIKAVREGTFSEHLYYRLADVLLELPPLRERRQDILPLARHFIRKYNEENVRHVSEQLGSKVRALLEQYQWPYNIRELESVIERAVVIAPSDEITLECLPPSIATIPEVVRKGHGTRVYISYPMDKFGQREFALRVSNELQMYCEVTYLERKFVNVGVVKGQPLEDADIIIALLATEVSRDTYFIEEVRRAVQLAKSQGSRPKIVPVCQGQAKDLPAQLASLFPHKLLEEWQWISDPSQLAERLLPLILHERGGTKNDANKLEKEAGETKIPWSPKWEYYYREYGNIASSDLAAAEKITRAFLLLEEMIREAGRDFNVPWHEQSSPSRIVSALVRQGLLTEKEQSDFIEMWNSRNRLMHRRDVTVDETSVDRTLELLKNLVRAFG